MSNGLLKGHLAAFVTCLIWGTTFISVKVLLPDFSPIEILIFRFVLGLAGLWMLRPKRLKVQNKKHEIMFALAGLIGVFLFYFTQYVALQYTSAANASVLVSLAPFATAVFSSIIWKEEKLNSRFLIKCVIAIAGTCLLFLSEEGGIKANLKGDFLALVSTLCWAVYSVLSKIINAYGYDEIQVTKKIFTYGVICMLPILLTSRVAEDLGRFANLGSMFNLIYLGLGASALCFVLWNKSVKHIGPVKASVYIYIMPVITIVASALLIQEQITVYTIIGTVLILAGLFIP